MVNGITQHSVILGVVVFIVALTFIMKSLELSELFISILSRLPQASDFSVRFDITLIHAQAELLQNLSTQIIGKGEWIRLDIRPRSLPYGLKIKIFFMLAATDISVIVPTLNEEKYLPECLRSLTNQSYCGDYEVIVVDGGSTDGTLEIAKKYTDNVLSAARRPVGAARNDGAKSSNGNIVAFIDADTIACKDWLDAIEVRFNDRNVIGVTGPTLPYDADVLDIVTYKFWTIYLQRILLTLGIPHVIGFNCAYRKRQFLQVGGFDETSVMSEDITLALKIRRLGNIVFEKEMSATTSPRRFQKYGHTYIAGLYLINGFSTLFLNRSSRNYPPVR